MDKIICKNVNCKKLFKKQIKNLISTFDYELCSRCRKYEKFCEVCNLKIYVQARTCSKECAWTLKKQSYLKSCNSEHNFSKNSISRKTWEARLFEEENIINVWQRESVKEKNKKTFLIKYGVDNPSKSDIIKKKKKDTLFKNYGVDSIFKILNYKNLNISYNDYLNSLMINKYDKKRLTNGYKISEWRKNNYVNVNIEKIRSTMEERGFWIPLSELSEWDLYRYNVNSFTKENLKKYGKIKFGDNWWIQLSTITKELITVDHMYSKKQGFLDKIPPEIIGNIVNLELLTLSENSSKNSKCSISKENLYENYNKLKLYENKKY